MLTMASGGTITNTNEDYALTDDGFNIETSNFFLESRAITFGDTPSSSIWHNQLTGTLTAEALENIFIDAGNSSAGGNVTIHLASGTLNDGNLIVLNLPTSDPGTPGALWNNSGNLQVSI